MVVRYLKLLLYLLIIFIITSSSSSSPPGKTSIQPPFDLEIDAINFSSVFNPLIIGEEGIIKIKCKDEQNFSVFFKIDWGDEITYWKGPYQPDIWYEFNHTYYEAHDLYFIKFKAINDPNNDGNLTDGVESEWSSYVSVKIKDGRPPYKPDLTGPTYGTVNIPVTFSATLYDFSDRMLTLQWDWGSGPINWMGTYYSNNTIQKDHVYDTAGTYEVKVRSAEKVSVLYKTGNPSEWSDTITIQINETQDETEEELKISTVNSVFEKETFTVKITVNNVPIENVEISFFGKKYYTNDQGLVEITAPEINENTSYYLTAKKEDYKTSTVSINIINREEVKKGWIYGLITDTNGRPIENALVCLYDLGSENSNCFTTDDKGIYNINFKEGSYRIEASKLGYKKSVIDSINIIDGTAIGQNFVLEKVIETGGNELSDNEKLVESTIQNSIELGNVAAKLSISNINQPDIQQYLENYEVKINEVTSHEIISFNVNGENNTPGTFFIVYIGKNIVNDPENLIVTYDEKEIGKMSIYSFLNPSENDQVGYVLLSAKEGYYIAVYVPHFSEHTIIISSITEIIEDIGLVTFISYIGISILIAIAIVAPIIYIDKRNS